MCCCPWPHWRSKRWRCSGCCSAEQTGCRLWQCRCTAPSPSRRQPWSRTFQHRGQEPSSPPPCRSTPALRGSYWGSTVLKQARHRWTFSLSRKLSFASVLHSLNRQRCLMLRKLSAINPRLTAWIVPHPSFNKGPPNGYVIIVFMCTYTYIKLWISLILNCKTTRDYPSHS